ncbi:helix-turn-helix transcriptional regulator [Erythrobacter sp. MTPC3]|uniref:S24 family peptidase n=1 Tax=Erythrobacter sp. MTPC3 TaxID=3056564 RepID=UPI0036F29F07
MAGTPVLRGNDLVMSEFKMTPERAKLLELSRAKGVSLSKMSELIGRNSAYLQQFIKRGSPRKLEEGDRMKLAQFFGVSDDVLSDSQENSYIEEIGAADSNYIEVPRLSVGASAGPGALSSQETPFDTFRFSRRWLVEQGLEHAQLSAITVEGDSMEPLLNDRDEILVDCSPRPLRDGIYVVRLGDTLVVKRVASTGGGRLALLSQNLAYPPVNVMAQDVEIIGRVVWKGGRI